MDGPVEHGGGSSIHPLLRLQDYKFGKRLGAGSFAKVKFAEHVPTGHKVAIKILNRMKNKGMEKKVIREINILRWLNHPHIIQLYDVIETETDIYIVMEYMKSGELFDYIVLKERLQEDEARKFFQQIISGVECCHKNMVVHRDLKLENILLDSEYNVKIADFGLSNIMRDGHLLKTNCGSRNYAAPEVLSGEFYGHEVDVWSCGVILYTILCGKLPFDISDNRDIAILDNKIKEGKYTLPSYLSPGARELISKMLEIDPMKRMTIPEIHQHPWFQLNLPYYLAETRPETMQQVDSSFSQMHEVAGHGIPGYMDPRAGLRPQLSVEKKWTLGLQSEAHPSAIMTVALEALQKLNVCWKQIGHYNMKCMWDDGFSGYHERTMNNVAVSNSNAVKFELQLYKTREAKYLLDLQRLRGPESLFLEICAAFLSQLRVF